MRFGENDFVGLLTCVRILYKQIWLRSLQPQAKINKHTRVAINYPQTADLTAAKTSMFAEVKPLILFLGVFQYFISAEKLI